MLRRLDGSRDLVLELAANRPVPLVIRAIESRLCRADEVTLDLLRHDLDRVAGRGARGGGSGREPVGHGAVYRKSGQNHALARATASFRCPTTLSRHFSCPRGGRFAAQLVLSDRGLNDRFARPANRAMNARRTAFPRRAPGRAFPVEKLNWEGGGSWRPISALRSATEPAA
jgi:hypothetical protein